jgi:hypothetical protein
MGSKLVKFETIDFPKTVVVGKLMRMKNDPGRNDNSISSLLDTMVATGDMGNLQNSNGCIAKNDYVGWMGDYDPKTDEYNYLAGVLFSSSITIPKGYEYKVIEATMMAIAWIRETNEQTGEDMHTDASAYMKKALEQNGFEYDFSKGAYEMEYYSFDRLLRPSKEGGIKILDFYTPCKKK